tara:strand:- start:722 stop:1009 length:288 start_codon:yes stop_codon:yes gene_type:complete
MSTHTVDKTLLDKIFNQLSGVVKKDEEPLPQMIIAGDGHMWCYDVNTRGMIRVSRGIKCFVLDDTLDENDRIMVYTIANDVILIEEDELIYIGFD